MDLDLLLIYLDSGKTLCAEHRRHGLRYFLDPGVIAVPQTVVYQATKRGLIEPVNDALLPGLTQTYRRKP